MPKRQDDRDLHCAEDAAAFERAFVDAADLRAHSYAARRILAMSAALFHRRGAAATSIRDITTACGLSPGALYKHFASKDDLLDVLVRHGHTSLESRIERTVRESGPDAVDRVAAFVRAYVLGHLEHPQLAQLVRREYLHLSPGRREATVRRRRRFRAQLSDLLLAGERSGALALIGGDADATRTAVMILDMCSRTSEWYDPKRADPPDELASRYVTAALRLAGALTTAQRPAVV